MCVHLIGQEQKTHLLGEYLWALVYHVRGREYYVTHSFARGGSSHNASTASNRCHDAVDLPVATNRSSSISDGPRVVAVMVPDLTADGSSWSFQPNLRRCTSLSRSRASGVTSFWADLTQQDVCKCEREVDRKKNRQVSSSRWLCTVKPARSVVGYAFGVRATAAAAAALAGQQGEYEYVRIRAVDATYVTRWSILPARARSHLATWAACKMFVA